MKFLCYVIVIILFLYIFMTLYKPAKKSVIIFLAAPRGSGKSCIAAKMAQAALKKGKIVYSTEYIDGCYKLSLKDLASYLPEKNSLLILEETGISLNSRKFATNDQGIISFIKLSRHCEADMIMISQAFSDTDKQIREASDLVYMIKPIIYGKLAMCIKCPSKFGIDAEGNFVTKYRIGRMGKLTYLPRYFKFYDSFTLPDLPKLPLELWNNK